MTCRMSLIFCLGSQSCGYKAPASIVTSPHLLYTKFDIELVKIQTHLILPDIHRYTIPYHTVWRSFDNPGPWVLCSGKRKITKSSSVMNKVTEGCYGLSLEPHYTSNLASKWQNLVHFASRDKRRFPMVLVRVSLETTMCIGNNRLTDIIP